METPAWPGFDRPVAEIRADTSEIENLGLEEIIDPLEEVVRAIDGPTIIMGHSFGGAITEVLLDRGLGDAGVGIDAAAVRGITKLPISTLRSAFPILKSPANGHRAVPITAEHFHYAFTNTMTAEESQPIYDRYAADRRWPGPRRPRQGRQGNGEEGGQGAGAHRVQGIPRALPLHGGAGRLGGGRRLRDRLGPAPARRVSAAA